MNALEPYLLYIKVGLAALLLGGAFYAGHSVGANGVKASETEAAKADVVKAQHDAAVEVAEVNAEKEDLVRQLTEEQNAAAALQAKLTQSSQDTQHALTASQSKYTTLQTQLANAPRANDACVIDAVRLRIINDANSGTTAKGVSTSH